MLAAYDQAVTHSSEQTVQTHHGVVGEADVRDWLATFLPKRYGVTSGQIRSQCLPNPHQSRDFDVIIYDQLEAPTLWIEDNIDKSDRGRKRIIPAEHVRAILEVKSAFNRRTVREAAEKLGELEPLTAGINAAGDRYPRYLPNSALFAMLFFELRATDQFDISALNLVRDAQFQRTFYGPVILRGEGLNPDDAALIQKYYSSEPREADLAEGGLLQGITVTATTEWKGRHISALLGWSDADFSRFAFYLLALLNGTYRPGFASSLHGFDVRDAESTK